MKESNSEREYLMLILKHQKGIQETLKEYGSNSLSEISKSNMCIKALSVDVNQIGEYANKLSEETRQSLNNVDINLAYKIRNRLAHGYVMVKPQEIILTALQLSSAESVKEVKKTLSAFAVQENKKAAYEIKLKLSSEIKHKIEAMEKKGVFFQIKAGGKMEVPEKAKDFLSQKEIENIQKSYQEYRGQEQNIFKGVEP